MPVFADGSRGSCGLCVGGRAQDAGEQVRGASVVIPGRQGSDTASCFSFKHAVIFSGVFSGLSLFLEVGCGM